MLNIHSLTDMKTLTLTYCPEVAPQKKKHQKNCHRFMEAVKESDNIAHSLWYNTILCVLKSIEGSTVVQWLALLPHSKKALGLIS